MSHQRFLKSEFLQTIAPSKNTGVSSHFLLQGIFPTQGSNPDLLHCRQILYHMNHQRSPNYCYTSLKYFTESILSTLDQEVT